MKQIITGGVAVFILLFCPGCGDTNNGTTGKTGYGHSSASFVPFVKIMEKMDREISALEPENDADRDFAKLMSIYHAGAIKMAGVEVKDGDDTAMVDIARKIIKDRISDTVILNGFIQSGIRGSATDQFIAGSVGMAAASNPEMQSRQGRTDVAFASMMKLHLERVMRTAALYLKYGAVDQMVKMAQDILSRNRRETEIVNRWLTIKIGHA